MKVPVSPEMWTSMHAPGLDPPGELGRRGVDVLRMRYEMDETEAQFIESDARYQDSCRAEYWAAKRTFDAHRKLPRKIVLEFSRPGSRTRRMNPRPDGEGE